MLRQIKLMILIFISFNTFGQNSYQVAFDKLNLMINNDNAFNFKDAVFITENAFFDNILDSNIFYNEIEKLVILTKSFISSSEIIYNGTDKEDIQKLGAIFTVMSDSIPIQIDSSIIAYHLPFSYDFNDIWGEQEWSNPKNSLKSFGK